MRQWSPRPRGASHPNTGSQRRMRAENLLTSPCGGRLLLDVRKYSWRTNGAHPGTYRIMSLYPWLFTWAVNEEGSADLVGACVSETPQVLVQLKGDQLET
jgi:hypothetical protein